MIDLYARYMTAGSNLASFCCQKEHWNLARHKQAKFIKDTIRWTFLPKLVIGRHHCQCLRHRQWRYSVVKVFLLPLVDSNTDSRNWMGNEFSHFSCSLQLVYSMVSLIFGARETKNSDLFGEDPFESQTSWCWLIVTWLLFEVSTLADATNSSIHHFFTNLQCL